MEFGESGPDRPFIVLMCIDTSFELPVLVSQGEEVKFGCEEAGRVRSSRQKQRGTMADGYRRLNQKNLSISSPRVCANPKDAATVKVINRSPRWVQSSPLLLLLFGGTELCSVPLEVCIKIARFWTGRPITATVPHGPNLPCPRLLRA